jgi:type I restriction enzyme S subunit
MSLQPCPCYRSTSATWLGSIPSHWQERPLWTMCERVKHVDHPNEQMLSVLRDHGVVAKDARENLKATAESLGRRCAIT